MFKLSGFGDEISQRIEEQMDVLESEGIRHIELRAVDNKNVLDLTDEDIERIKKALKGRGFQISAIGSPIGKIKITDDFDLHLKQFSRAMYLAHFFETPYIRIFSYYIPEDEDPAKYRDQVLYRMDKKTKLAHKEGLTLLHENERDIYGDIPERCRDILSSVGQPDLRATFDPANFVIDNVKPYDEAYPLLEEYIEYLHIKDAKFSTEDMIITPAGEGDGQIFEVLSALQKKNFNGFLSLEPHLTLAGRSKGFSGPELFKKAIQALKKVLEETKTT